MEQVVEDLIDLLNNGKENYLELENLSIAKKSIIIEADIKKLDEIVINEKVLIEKINKTNDLIRVKTNSLCEHLKIAERNLSISKIAVLYSLELRKRLLNIAIETTKIFKRLKDLNNLNQGMLSKRLSHIKSKMDLMIFDNEALIYDHGGNDKLGNRQKINIFDAKV